uniref:uncharacterized protein LOC125388499 n=1 Tax=Myodes glareolus TaxID=447135 RepID=UPI002020B00E|nr:uncharacterized protein LOC125388499 [Myodes glareolus]
MDISADEGSAPSDNQPAASWLPAPASYPDSLLHFPLPRTPDSTHACSRQSSSSQVQAVSLVAPLPAEPSCRSVRGGIFKIQKHRVQCSVPILKQNISTVEGTPPHTRFNTGNTVLLSLHGAHDANQCCVAGSSKSGERLAPSPPVARSQLLRARIFNSKIAASTLASPLPFLFSSGFSWTTASEGTRAASWCPTWDCYGESFLPEHHICWSSSSVALRSQATAGCPGGAHPQVTRHKTPRLRQHEAGSWEPGLSSGLDSRYRATVTFNTNHPWSHPRWSSNMCRTFLRYPSKFWGHNRCQVSWPTSRGMHGRCLFLEHFY